MTARVIVMEMLLMMMMMIIIMMQTMAMSTWMMMIMMLETARIYANVVSRKSFSGKESCKFTLSGNPI